MAPNNIEALAVIGIGISGTKFTGIDQYGFEVYRGIEYSGNRRILTQDEALQSTLDQVRAIININPDRTLFLVMDSHLADLIKDGNIGNSLDLFGKSLPDIFSEVSNLLSNKKKDLVVLADRFADKEIFSIVVLTSEDFAQKSKLSILGRISVGKNEIDKNSELLLIDGTIQTYLQNYSSEESKDFQLSGKHSCALAESTSGLSSLVKLIWCMCNRVIPGNFEWTLTEVASRRHESEFYIPTESRTWFIPTSQKERIATLAITNETGNTSYFPVSSKFFNPDVQVSKQSLEDLYVFPFAGTTVNEIIGQLASFRNTDFSQTNIRQASRFQYGRWQKREPNSLTACLLARNSDELQKEIEFGLTGISEASERSVDWRTPVGSTFSPDPLGRVGSISFVYPGAFNSYPGVGRDLFYLFPYLYERLSKISTDIGNLINERQLYPRSITKLNPMDLELCEKDLTADPLAMLISGTSLAAVYTFLLREVFNIHPASSLGYSLGEISMMFASGVWTKADQTSVALKESPLFHNRLAGSQDAVREYWLQTGELPDAASARLWANFVLMASFDTVKAQLESTRRVYVTHINTPRQVVIGGHPDDCRALIAKLKCPALEAPFNYALHNVAMESEIDALQTLHTWQVQADPGMVLYSAATNKPMPVNENNIARQIAYGLTHMLDFPRLVNTAYDDGARIFIELGAGSNCTRWVDDSLAGRKHAAFSINRKGVDDSTAILQLLARLISHNVPVNLSSVFG